MINQNAVREYLVVPVEAGSPCPKHKSHDEIFE